MTDLNVIDIRLQELLSDFKAEQTHSHRDPWSTTIRKIEKLLKIEPGRHPAHVKINLTLRQIVAIAKHVQGGPSDRMIQLMDRVDKQIDAFLAEQRIKLPPD